METKPILIAARSRVGSIDAFTQDYLAALHMPAVLSLADGTCAPRPIATVARIDFTDDALFTSFRGSFESLRYAEALPVDPGTGKSHLLWVHSDVYEFFAGPNSRATGLYKEFQVAPDARFFDINVNRAQGNSNTEWCSGMQCRSFVDTTRKLWMAVMQIPWNCFDADYRSDCVWDINLYRATGRFHGDELLAWSPTGYGDRAFHRYEKFGRLVFQK